MATVNLGNIKLNWKGAYNAGTAYVIDDVVSYNGSSYVCISATTGNLPTVTAKWNQMSAAGTNGTDVGTTITTQGDLLYRDGSGLQRLAAGTSGQVLQTGGTGANPSWGTVSSDFVKIAGGNTTSSGTIDITGCFSTDYKFYKLFCNHNFVSQSYIEVAMLNTNGTMDGAAYYARGNGEYSNSGSGNARWTNPANQNTWYQSDNDGFRPINTWNSFQTDEHSMLEMTFDNPIATRKTMAHWTATWSGGGSDHVGMSHGIGMLDSTNSHSGLRLSSKDNSINFTTTGYYAVYGLKN